MKLRDQMLMQARQLDAFDRRVEASRRRVSDAAGQLLRADVGSLRAQAMSGDADGASAYEDALIERRTLQRVASAE